MLLLMGLDGLPPLAPATRSQGDDEVSDFYNYVKPQRPREIVSIRCLRRVYDLLNFCEYYIALAVKTFKLHWHVLLLEMLHSLW
ncbi:hypothetical protein scyTo_0007082 [Scyliorhinus torazame]|uniref:Uncharacterized protein n=1 Tax=Scyliorhinus torazame TaxID=75743 RepID=A0A401NLA3_SCYTO|nr:hypothetical protein [Scyliorhinus torazame]